MTIEEIFKFIDNMIDQYEKGIIDDLYFYEHYDDYRTDSKEFYFISHHRLEETLRKIIKKYSNTDDIFETHREIDKIIQAKNRDKIIDDLFE